MADARMKEQISHKPGFIAALDQSGGSTPGALAHYGIPEGSYHGDEEMFRLMHEMRSRIITAPSFTGDKVIAAILFERTMDGTIEGKQTPSYLWEDRGIVPFLKIDKGLEDEKQGVRLMKPIPGLDTLLARAAKLGIYGTKERSVVNLPDRAGIAAIVKQQYEIGAQVAAHGLVPILEPEVLVKSPDKAGAEAILLDELTKGLDSLPGDYPIMLKITIPEKPDLYAGLMKHPRMQRIVALSGGYPLDVACEKLKANHGMIASFSRALVDDLRASMSDKEFDDVLAKTIAEINDASVNKLAKAA
ncbi:fructose-1,6-bisphosphate aldolase [Neoasaia chiangmaiensis NBRC 101099]|uniref:fructose-bisphosphate aldolase n=1 Tax=Neoasaia chiangmaiensis TaxID=320497 RepID=A0A1U9KPU6_9PROT|nr:fructose bisphosphate aldolase [Neoasaia chiangmaiensis]AQS87842.1 class I fructose-bisphosphate aldolase [Neoasaia chiangmaiensis]GBR35895.1 fructose-1,6-bisphosphate aldolase [Neoasaia chiangmaiensis NBRC 101099]GEN14461.1 class I fructose-bisphosphate aldolase [Neoasaia chiangmaiensis]